MGNYFNCVTYLSIIADLYKCRIERIYAAVADFIVAMSILLFFWKVSRDAKTVVTFEHPFIV